MGIANAGGAGRAIAEWIVDGEPTLDLWQVDIRRFAGFNNNRAGCTSGPGDAGPALRDALARPRTGDRPRLRRSPLFDRLAAKGASFGTKMGWERANWFARSGREHCVGYSWGRQNWFDAVGREKRAAREAVVLFDQTSFAKLLLQGRDACRVLNRLCAAEMDVPVGSMRLYRHAQRARRLRVRPDGHAPVGR